MKSANLVLEMHIIQQFGHHLLNRDKAGNPKTEYLGGVRRLSVSSQCWKRSICEMFADDGLLKSDELALRTNHVVDRIVDYVTAPEGTDPLRVKAAAARALAVGRFKTDPQKGHATQYLHYIPVRILPELGAIVTEHLEQLMPPPRLWRHKTSGRTVSYYGPDPWSDAPGDGKDDWKADSLDEGAPDSGNSDAAKGKNGDARGDAKSKNAGKAAKRQEKSAAKSEIPAEVANKILSLLLDARRTPQIALFGRMVADAKESSVEAACQVAFAVTTHAAEIGHDFWTGLSDDKKADESGADMIGTAPFASGSCFYRYLSVDVAELVKNLGGDADAKDQARRTLDAFLRAAIKAIPKGKQSSTGARNLPSLVLINIREDASASLSNAFTVPVYPTATEHGGMVDKSILKLGEYLREIDGMYGADGRKALLFSLIDPAKTLAPAFLERLPSAQHCRPSDDGRPAIDVLIERAVSAAFGA